MCLFCGPQKLVQEFVAFKNTGPGVGKRGKVEGKGKVNGYITVPDETGDDRDGPEG